MPVFFLNALKTASAVSDSNEPYTATFPSFFPASISLAFWPYADPTRKNITLRKIQRECNFSRIEVPLFQCFSVFRRGRMNTSRFHLVSQGRCSPFAPAFARRVDRCNCRSYKNRLTVRREIFRSWIKSICSSKGERFGRQEDLSTPISP